MSFEIIRRGIVLHARDNRTQIAGYPTVGDVARLEDGRLVARWLADCEGGPQIVCREWREGENPIKTDQPVPKNWPAWFRSQKDGFAAGSHRTTLADVFPDDDSELARFHREWPVVSSLLELVPAQRPAAVVDPGEIFYPRDLVMPRWSEYLSRHVAGNLGAFCCSGSDHRSDGSVIGSGASMPNAPRLPAT
jgi:hypothetical protein